MSMVAHTVAHGGVNGVRYREPDFVTRKLPVVARAILMSAPVKINLEKIFLIRGKVRGVRLFSCKKAKIQFGSRSR